MSDVASRVPAHLLAELAALDGFARAVEAAVDELRDRTVALRDQWNTTAHPSLAEPGTDGDLDSDLMEASGLELLHLRLDAIGLRAQSVDPDSVPSPHRFRLYGFSGPGIDDYVTPGAQLADALDWLERDGELIRVRAPAKGDTS